MPELSIPDPLPLDNLLSLHGRCAVVTGGSRAAALDPIVWRLRWPENGGRQPPLYRRQTAARCSVPVDCVA
jgi:hypothetical protein